MAPFPPPGNVGGPFRPIACGAGGPGRSGGCPPELPQSRACGFPAPGSSRRGSAVPHTAKRFCGDTPSRLGVLGMVPTPRHDAAPPSLHGVREGSFPRFSATMRRCDSLPPISPHFVSFAWRYHRCVRCSSPPAPDAEPWINLELLGGISSRLARWKRQGLPSSQGIPCDHSPCSSTPA